MVEKGTWAKHNPCVPPPAAPGASDGEAEQEVAAALQSLSASLQTSGGAAGGEADRGVVDSRRGAGARGKRGADSAAKPAGKQQAQRPLQRSGSSGARRASALIAAVEAKSERGPPAK